MIQTMSLLNKHAAVPMRSLSRYHFTLFPRSDCIRFLTVLFLSSVTSNYSTLLADPTSRRLKKANSEKRDPSGRSNKHSSKQNSKTNNSSNNSNNKMTTNIERTVGDDRTAAAASYYYYMPHENEVHEGTWLQWPHHYEYGKQYRTDVEPTWIEMTRALTVYGNENIHIIAYNQEEKDRIVRLLNDLSISSTKIDFYIYPTNDVWVRDNGPIFVRRRRTGTNTNDGMPIIEDWGFNGWGKKFKYEKSTLIPKLIGKEVGTPVLDLNAKMVLEGGAFEIDGDGTFMATKSSTLNKNRNKGMTQAQAEAILKTYLGVSNFIWLDGVAGLETTDMHIDGFMKFHNSTTIVTMKQNDLLEMGVPQSDITKLYNAKNAKGQSYKYIYVPATKLNVKTSYGKKLPYKGSYVNYYVANGVVLLPSYNDDNDIIAKEILQTKLFATGSEKRVVQFVDVRNLYENGGMVHCVTQQQPA